MYLLAARYSHKENLFMNTENDAVIEEMRFFKVNVIKSFCKSGIILACAMCAMAHRFLKWRIEIFAMRHNGAHIFVTAHLPNLGAP